MGLGFLGVGFWLKGLRVSWIRVFGKGFLFCGLVGLRGFGSTVSGFWVSGLGTYGVRGLGLRVSGFRVSTSRVSGLWVSGLRDVAGFWAHGV